MVTNRVGPSRQPPLSRLKGLNWRWIGAMVALIYGANALIVGGLQLLGVPIYLGSSLQPATAAFGYGSSIEGLLWLIAGWAILRRSRHAALLILAAGFASLIWTFVFAGIANEPLALPIGFATSIAIAALVLGPSRSVAPADAPAMRPGTGYRLTAMYGVTLVFIVGTLEVGGVASAVVNHMGIDWRSLALFSGYLVVGAAWLALAALFRRGSPSTDLAAIGVGIGSGLWEVLYQFLSGVMGSGVGPTLPMIPSLIAVVWGLTQVRARVV